MPRIPQPAREYLDARSIDIDRLSLRLHDKTTTTV
jgi:hypothetical protein